MPGRRLRSRPGRGRVVRELLRALAVRDDDDHRYLLLCAQAWTDVDLDERFSWRLIGGAIRGGTCLRHVLASRECDVFLSSNSYVTPLFLRGADATVVYDLVTFDRSMHPNRRSTGGRASHARAGGAPVGRVDRDLSSDGGRTRRALPDSPGREPWSHRLGSRPRSPPTRIRRRPTICHRPASCLQSARWSRARTCHCSWRLTGG